MKKLGFGLLTFFVASAVLFASGGQQQQGSVASGSGAVTITVEIFDRGTDGGKTDPANNKWTAWIKEKILKDENIIVNFVSVPRWTETEALINLFAAGNPPDVCYTYSGDNIQMWADQGGVYDVSPYLNTVLKDLNAFLGPDTARPGHQLIERNIDLGSGKVYSMPAKRMNIANQNLFIRKDWLDILGLPVPQTTQQFWDTLVAFRDNAAKLGVSRVIPYSMAADRPDALLGIIMEAFINPNLSDKERWITTVVDRNLLVEGYKEGVRFANRMYNANLIDKDWPLYKDMDTGPVDIIKSGVVGAFCWNWDVPYRESYNLLTDLRKNVPNADYIPVDCIQSSDGKTHTTSYDIVGLNYFIPASSKNPNAAMRYLNWLAKYDNYHFIQTGPLGITHTIGSDGVVKLDPSAPADPSWIMNSSQNIDYTIMMNGLFLESDEASIRALAAGYSAPADVIQNAYNVSLANSRPPVFVKPTSALTVAGPLAQTLQDKGKVIFTQSINCTPENFDRIYDAGIADWLASGAQAIMDERRAKYPE
jgi:putative aldouronate transport system substrate-binding protein